MRRLAKGKYEYWLTAEGLLRLGAWARDGLTDEQISKNIGISRKTLAEWKNRFSDICDTLKKNKEVADIEVENALHKRAVGYKTVEQRVEESEKDGKKIITISKEVAPETAAAIFWLKNRQPNKWRDKHDVNASVVEDTVADKLREVFGGAPE